MAFDSMLVIHDCTQPQLIEMVVVTRDAFLFVLVVSMEMILLGSCDGRSVSALGLLDVIFWLCMLSI